MSGINSWKRFGAQVFCLRRRNDGPLREPRWDLMTRVTLSQWGDGESMLEAEWEHPQPGTKYFVGFHPDDVAREMQDICNMLIQSARGAKS